MPRELTSTDFDQAIADNTIVLVDFWAIWCGPCRAMVPVLEQLEKDMEVVVAKVDVDSHGDLAVRFNISSIPTLILFVDGKQVAQTMGAQSLPKLTEWIRRHIHVSPEATT